ncbi:hypothetical protein [Williamsia serinedens]|uniref:Uncharacterized protein n=1 Tax=Williamsia serinedens TaxID=391736 RepID=A0ABT1H2Q6_9NOCA|nr:hypothetical protein [Williamsia serinedens]MCP2161522.1 hypothetical protein [Williamsia serinedens]
MTAEPHPTKDRIVAAVAARDLAAAGLDHTAPGVNVAALYPSPHLNLADDLRQLASFDDAAGPHRADHRGSPPSGSVWLTPRTDHDARQPNP